VFVEAIPPKFTLGVEAYLPEGWVPDGRTKLEVYKRLAACETAADLARQTAGNFAAFLGPTVSLQTA